MQAGVVAACAALPLKSVLAHDGLDARRSLRSNPRSMMFSPSQTSQEQLGYYTRTSFAPYVNTQFKVYMGPSDTRGLKLREVTNYVAALPSSLPVSNASQIECFSLLFTAPGGGAFGQDTYLMEHEALGNFYLFMVPISAQSKKATDYYEAIIYRAPVESLAPNGVPKAPESKQESAAAAVAAGTATGVRLSKTEQEVYYFRPDKIKRPKAKKTDPGAEGRRAAQRLSMSQAPDIVGLRLGMTMEQVVAAFPGCETDKQVRASLNKPANRYGVKTLVITPWKFSTEKRFEGVNQVALTLLDGQVASFSVYYNSPTWTNVNDFVSKFSQEKGLPGADSWDARSGADNQMKTLKCRDFEINLFAGGENISTNYVQMRDLSAQQKLKGRSAG